MRGLKTAFYMMFGLGAAMIVAAPLMLGMRPLPGAPAADRSRFAMILGLYILSLLFLFLGVAIVAWRLMVLQREEIRKEAAENMRELIEGTLSDHERKAESES